MYAACSLARKGYYGGNPSNVLKERVDVVISLLHYELKIKKYEAYMMEVTKDEDR